MWSSSDSNSSSACSWPSCLHYCDAIESPAFMRPMTRATAATSHMSAGHEYDILGQADDDDGRVSVQQELCSRYDDDGDAGPAGMATILAQVAELLQQLHIKILGRCCRPSPFLVEQARLAIARIDADLAFRLESQFYSQYPLQYHHPPHPHHHQYNQSQLHTPDRRERNQSRLIDPRSYHQYSLQSQYHPASSTFDQNETHADDHHPDQINPSLQLYAEPPSTFDQKECLNISCSSSTGTASSGGAAAIANDNNWIALLDSSVQKLEEDTRRIGEEAEKKKLPYRSILCLFELQQLYQELLIKNSSRQGMKSLEARLTEREAIELMSQTIHSQKNDVDLSGKLLHSLPPFTQTSTLLRLNISGNQLKDLPCSIGDLYNLETLDLHSNQLVTLPNTIGFLECLKTLNISGNMLRTLPDSIARCRALVELNVGFNELNYLPSGIGDGLVSLEILSLHSNKLSFLPPSICHLRHLMILDLHFNKLKCLPQSIGKLRALKKLNISNNFTDFGGEIPNSIGNLRCLVELDLSFNQVRVLPDAIGALSQSSLKVLKVDNNPLLIPPVHVVEHSMKAVIEYMEERWEASKELKEGLDYEIIMPSRLMRSNTIHNGSYRRLPISTSSSCVGINKSWLTNWFPSMPTTRHKKRHNPVPINSLGGEWTTMKL